MTEHSFSGGSFNARVAKEEQTPPTAHREGRPQPAAPKHPGYTSHHSDYIPSESPTLSLPGAAAISDGIRGALYRADREISMSNGESGEDFDARHLKQALAAAFEGDGRMNRSSGPLDL